jgi:hypothetical protein
MNDLKKLTFTLGAASCLLPFTAVSFAFAFSAPSTVSRSRSHAAFVGTSASASISISMSASTTMLTSPTQLASSTTGGSNAGFYTDDEWHPHDPAETTPQLLASIWDQIANGLSMVKGVSTKCCFLTVETIHKNKGRQQLILPLLRSAVQEVRGASFAVALFPCARLLTHTHSLTLLDSLNLRKRVLSCILACK